MKECHIGRDEVLHQNDTQKLSVLPKGKKVIGFSWAFAKKHRFQNGETVGYKAILVAKGYAQKDEIITTRCSHML